MPTTFSKKDAEKSAENTMSGGSSTLLTVAVVIVSFALVFGGFWMLGHAFSQEGHEFTWFFGGVLVDALGLWVAFGLLPWIERSKA